MPSMMGADHAAVALCSPVWSIEGGADIDGGRVEVRHYAFPRPSVFSELDENPVLSVVLPRPGALRGEVCSDAAPRISHRLGAVMLRPGSVGMRAVGEGGALTVLRCQFDLALFVQVTGVEDWDARRLKQCANLQSQPLLEIARRLRREVLAPGLGAEFAKHALLRLALVEIGRVLSGPVEAPVSRGGLAPWQLSRIDARLRACTGAWPTLAELATECRLSGHYLSRAFAQTSGVSLGKYMAAMRLELAKELMTNPSLGMCEIAARLGFSSASAFSAAFHRATGQTPLKYARRLRALNARQ